MSHGPNNDQLVHVPPANALPADEAQLVIKLVSGLSPTQVAQGLRQKTPDAKNIEEAAAGFVHAIRRKAMEQGITPPSQANPNPRHHAGHRPQNHRHTLGGFGIPDHPVVSQGGPVHEDEHQYAQAQSAKAAPLTQSPQTEVRTRFAKLGMQHA